VPRAGCERAEPLLPHAPSPSFRLLNLRQPARFVYFANGTLSPTALAKSAPLAFANANEPTGVHLALTGTAGELRASWSSRDTTAVAGPTAPSVQWGLSANALLFLSPATTRTYSRADLCGNPDGSPSVATGKGYLDAGEQHSGVMGLLPPSSTVFYRVGSNATGWSRVFRAATPPAVGAAVSLLVVSDMGQAEADGSNIVSAAGPLTPFASSPQWGNLSYYRMPSSLATAARIAADLGGSGWPASSPVPSLVFNNGDLSYANGYAPLWDAYMDVIQPAAAVAPWMVSVGNHESDYEGSPHGDRFTNLTARDSGGECGVVTAARFPMPPPWAGGGAGGGWPAGTPGAPNTPWYSFDLGVIHFTVMSTEHPFDSNSPQFAWLSADLAAAAAARDAAAVSPGPPASAQAPRWLVFAGHRPFFLSVDPTLTDLPIAFELEKVMGPLWQQFGVDLTLAGHHHSYQRTHVLSMGVNQSACPDGQLPGTVHVVAGHGGAHFSPFGSGDPEEALIAFKQNTQHGYLRLSADALQLTLSAVSTADGAIIDAVTLLKSADAAAPRCAPFFDIGASVAFPTLERSTLGVMCVLFSLISVAYLLRAYGQRSEALSHVKHNRAGLAALLQERHAEEEEEASRRRQSLESELRSNPASRSVSRRTSVTEEGLEAMAAHSHTPTRLAMEVEAAALPPRPPPLPPPPPHH